MSWAEAKWIVDTVTQKTGQPPNNMQKLTASLNSDGTTISLYFLEPEDSVDKDENTICTVGGVMIRVSDTGYPKSLTDGELVIDNTDLGQYSETPFAFKKVTKGKTYYFRAFPYSKVKVCNQSSNASNRAQVEVK